MAVTLKSWSILLVAMTTGMLGLSGCTINLKVGNSAPEESVAEQLGSTIYSDQEIMFAEMMIPHHQQALQMSDLARAISGNKQIRSLAQNITDGQEPEIAQMALWLDSSPSVSPPGHMNHGGMMMGGMATDEQMAELATLTSPDFDRQFLVLMIEHHEGAIDMVRMIENSDNPEVKTLAEDILRVQRQEISSMKELLDDPSGS